MGGYYSYFVFLWALWNVWNQIVQDGSCLNRLKGISEWDTEYLSIFKDAHQILPLSVHLGIAGNIVGVPQRAFYLR